MNMYRWVEKMIFEEEKKALPILAFPAVQLLFVTVKELIEDSRYQALGMRLLADQYDMPAAMSYMDLSVEAEAFGAHTVYAADEIPTVTGRLIGSREAAEALKIPGVGDGRTGVCVDGIKKALRLITDRPVIANCIGPFSLAGRLMNVNDIMLACYDEPETVHIVLKKATEFLRAYIRAFKAAGAHGVVMAEPLAGLLSPALIQEFSSDYIRQLTDELQDERFIIIYHNCGGSVNKLVTEILSTGCKGYHFGDAVNMREMLEQLPRDVLVMGNISPAKHFLGGTPQSVRNKTNRLLRECAEFPNFLVSSGCDIPPLTDLENVNTFFETVEAFYYRRRLLDSIS